MTRATDLRDLVRTELHLSSTDVSDTNAATLFTELLKIYSRFRGKRKTKSLTYAAETLDYAVGINDDDYIIGVYWNDTYPEEYSAVSESESMVSEQYHNPALKAIDSMKQRRQAQQADVNEQNWSEFYDSDTRKIHLVQQPETNILVEYREVYATDTYPQNDRNLLKEGLKAQFLEYVRGVAELKSHGDVTYNLTGMRKAIDRHWGNFYKSLQTVGIGRE